MSLGFLSGTKLFLSKQIKRKQGLYVTKLMLEKQMVCTASRQRLLHPLKLLSRQKSTSENKNQDTLSVLAPNLISVCHKHKGDLP